jgi:hypothetical protein
MLRRIFLIWMITSVAAVAQNAGYVRAIELSDNQVTWDWEKKGIEWFQNKRYEDATEAFQRVVKVKPTSIQAHLNLATVFSMRLTSPILRREAQQAFEAVVQLDPRNLIALQSLAFQTQQQAEWTDDLGEKTQLLDRAAEWNRKVIEVIPQELSDTFYFSLGVIACLKVEAERGAARVRLGVPYGARGPFPDEKVRKNLRDSLGPVIDDGIQNLQRALEMDRGNHEAMTYVIRLINERAVLRETVHESEKDYRSADEWIEKAKEAKKASGAQVWSLETPFFLFFLRNSFQPQRGTGWPPHSVFCLGVLPWRQGSFPRWIRFTRLKPSEQDLRGKFDCS